MMLVEEWNYAEHNNLFTHVSTNDMVLIAIDCTYDHIRVDLYKASKTLRKLRPKECEWFAELLADAAILHTLKKKIESTDWLIDIYPAPKP